MQASKQAGAPAISRRVVAATVIGNALEFYDFVTYAFFAVYIGKTFFPAGNEFISLLMSVAVFGVGFFTRPLGGILIGAYADRAGRKPAMLLTIVLITIGTLGLALTPSYESIGIAAPIIVVLARLIQGLALGGEIGPSSAFLIESAPAGQRGLYGSWQLASQGIASAVAGGFGMMLAASLSQAELQAWGWRVPFAVGLLLIPLAIYLRKSMPETLEHGPSGAPQEKAGPLLRQHSRLITLALLAIMGGTVSTYVNNYMTTFAINTLKFPPVTAMAATVVGGCTTLAFALLGGWLCDRVGRRSVMLVPRLGAALLTYPAFMFMIEQKTPAALFAVALLLSALTAMSGAASLVAIPELLPRRVRAIGLSLVYAFAVTIFGGTTQLVVTWLIEATGNPASPAWYVTITSAIAAIAMWLMPEGRNQKLN